MMHNNNMNAGRNGSTSSRNTGSKANKKNMQAFKSEVANSMNVDLKKGYNGDLTSREAGSVGGEMVKRMIAYAQNNMKDDGSAK